MSVCKHMTTIIKQNARGSHQLEMNVKDEKNESCVNYERERMAGKKTQRTCPCLGECKLAVIYRSVWLNETENKQSLFQRINSPLFKATILALISMIFVKS